jgi:hypothetical protein
MNKKIIFLILIIVAGILAFPAYENQRIEKAIAQEKAVLNAGGMKLNISTKEGYFVSIRKYDLTIQNGQEIANMMKDNMIKVYPLYQDSIEAYFQKNQTKIAKSLEGAKFSGLITVDNLMLNKPNLRIVLKELPTALMKNVQKDPAMSEVVLPWLDHGLIAFKVIFNRDGSIERVAMRNFNEKFASRRKTRENHIKLLGNQLIVLGKNRGEYHMHEESIESKNLSNNQVMMMQLKDLKYKFQYDDMLNQASNLTLDNFIFKMDGKRRGGNFALKNFVIDSNIVSNKDKSNLMADYKIDSINFSARKQLFKLDKFKFKLALNDLDTPALKSLISSYGKIMTQRKHYPRTFKSDIVAVVNKGFNLEVDGGIKDAQYSIFSLKSFDFTMHLKMAPNKLDRYSRPKEMEQYVSMTSDIRVTQNDIDQIALINPRLVDHLKKYAKKDGDNVSFHVVLEKSKLTVNGKDL